MTLQFAATPRPSTSPCGQVQHAIMIAHGIWQVSTASHGGLVLSDQRAKAMPEALALDGSFYEEDCDWALVVLAFEAEFAASGTYSAGEIQLAHDSVKCWHPDRYTAFTGEAVPANTSRVLMKRRAYTEVMGDYCVCSAWGTWADWVPEGKVGVLARKVISIDHLGWPRYDEDEVFALVDKGDYEKRGEVFALGLHAHEVIEAPGELRSKEVTL